MSVAAFDAPTPGMPTTSVPDAAAPLVCVLAGSPRRAGVSAHLAQVAARGIRQAGASCDLRLLADYDMRGCTGCGYCDRTGSCALGLAEAREKAAADSASKDGGSRLYFDDLYRSIASAQALVLVAPVYFAGPPSQLKAFFDRMQFLWSQRYLLHRNPLKNLGDRKPCALVVTGGGGDPFGYAPLEQCARSSLRMADFELLMTLDCVGWQPDLSTLSGDSDGADAGALAGTDESPEGRVLALCRDLVRRLA